MFQIELLHEKIGTILYMGDLQDKLYRDEITQKDFEKITNSTFANYQYMDPSFIYNEKYIKNFSVKNKDFIFNLTQRSCYYMLNGTRSLNIPKNNVSLILKQEFDKTVCFDNYTTFIKYIKSQSNSILYCRNLANSIKRDGFHSAICIYHYKCNHYDFVDGQHRSFIASKLNIPIPANVDDLTSKDYSCSYCEMKKRIQNDLKLKKKN